MRICFSLYIRVAVFMMLNLLKGDRISLIIVNDGENTVFHIQIPADEHHHCLSGIIFNETWKNKNNLCSVMEER